MDVGMAQIWRIDDVIAYLEEKISDDLASSVETRFYENYNHLKYTIPYILIFDKYVYT